MKKLLFTLIVLVSTHTFAKPVEIETMSTLYSTAITKIREHGAANVLIVFDIDNTLLTTNQDFASYAWSSWQKDLIKKKAPHAITDNFKDFHNIETTLQTLGKMHPPETQTPSIVAAMQALGAPVIALTSRGAQMRSVTERELLSNRYNLASSNFPLGFPGVFYPNDSGSLPVSFQQGIYLTRGQHKGEMLKSLLSKLSLRYKCIIFVDDLEKHTRHVSETFKYLGDNIITFTYNKLQQQFQKFLTGDKTKVIQQWKQLHSVWKQIFKVFNNREEY